MTRINVGVRPQELSRQHLLAEHREIKRIPNVIKGGKAILTDIPEKFTLGKGHVKFFYNKLKYLHKRYLLLYEECIKRGYKVTNYNQSFENLPVELYNDYIEDDEDRKIVLKRIAEKQIK